MSDGGKLHFFISYTAHAEADNVLASYLARGVRHKGHNVFLDKDISAGTRWAEQIETSLNSCNRFVVLLSEASVARDMVVEEVRRAYEREKSGSLAILPVRMRLNEGYQLPYELSAKLTGYQAISWNGPQDNEIVLAKVLGGVPRRGEREQPSRRIEPPSEALLHLLKGHVTLARRSAARALELNSADAQAAYVSGRLELEHPIAQLHPDDADRAECFLRTSSDLGLAPQCALPRIALRYDHYKYWKRKEPDPTLRDLIEVYYARKKEAECWPYDVLNSRLPTSPKFKVFWKK
jgi:hypothetical protein